MTAAIDPHSLLMLAQSRHPADRERLLEDMVDYCDQAELDALSAPAMREMIGSVFMTLVAEAERSDLAPPLRAAALAAFSTSVQRHGVLLTCGHVRAVATRYTLASEASPGTSVTGDILQVLETADRKHRAVRPDAPHTRPTR